MSDENANVNVEDAEMLDVTGVSVTTVSETSLSSESVVVAVDGETSNKPAQHDETAEVTVDNTLADTEQPEKQPTSCNLVSGYPDPDEPVIEIPFRTESSGEVFKL